MYTDKAWLHSADIYRYMYILQIDSCLSSGFQPIAGGGFGIFATAAGHSSPIGDGHVSVAHGHRGTGDIVRPVRLG